MNKIEFDIYFKKIGLIPKKNQFEFYNNTHIFLSSEKEILINEGGMGLGKTLAICIAFSKFLQDFDQIYIATPYSKVKKIWCEELNRLKIKNYIEWLSKRDCLSIYHKNINDCDDGCEHRKHLESKDGYTSECYYLLDKLNFPLIASEWYKKHGTSDCLLSPIRCGLKERKIAVGDYFPIMNLNMANKIIFEKTPKRKNNSLLIIDEAHRFPERVENYFSKELDLTYLLKQLQKSEEKYKLSRDEKVYVNIEKGLSVLKKLENKLKKDWESKEKKGNQARYTYEEFEKDFNNFNEINLDSFFSNLKDASRLLSKEEYETEEDPQLKRLYKFLENWREKVFNKGYGQYFQYSEYGNENIKIIVACEDIGKIVPYLFENWKKVILLSGTIHPNFIQSIGLNEKEIMRPENLSSFSIKKNTLIYPYDNFNWENREETIKNNSEKFNKIIKNMKGRILIVVKSKSQGDLLINQIKNRETYNLGRFFGDNLKKEIIKFSNSKNGIAILNVLGRVEGENFLNEEENAIENVVIYGYPHMIPNYYKEDKIIELIKKYNSKKIANAYLEYIPRGNIIQQATTRAKRNEKDNPIIILWGDAFKNIRPEYHYLPDDLKGKFVYSFDDLLKEVKGRDDKTNS